jgi:SAM-dependent methyltransferase
MAIAISSTASRSLLTVLEDNDFIVDVLQELTAADRGQVIQKLAREHLRIGAAVEEDLNAWNLTPHVWTDRLAEFYEHSDAFLYETLVWNRTAMKQQMRQWIVDFLAADSPGPCRTIMFGDGLGIDSLFFSEAGHDVDYFEVSRRCVQFATRLSEPLRRDLSVISSPQDIVAGSYDVVVCLDVLEHVPDPPAVVAQLASFLRPGGRLIVHAPFWYIHPDVATHLKSNVRYSGDLALYRAHGLRPIAAALFWNPIVLEKISADVAPTPRSAASHICIGFGGSLLTIGRFFRLPHLLVSKWLAKPDSRRLASIAAELTA